MPIFDWKCPDCNSTMVVLWRSCSEAMDNEGEIVDKMWIADIFFQCKDCGKEFQL